MPIKTSSDIKETGSISASLQNCLNKGLMEGEVFTEIQGGYSVISSNVLYMETNDTPVAYGYYLGKNVLVSKQTMANEIGQYAGIYVQNCFNGENFPNLKINLGEPSLKVTILNSSILADANIPMTVSNNETSSILKADYESRIASNLSEVYALSQQIIQNEINNPAAIDITTLQNSGFNVTLSGWGKDIFVYSIYDKIDKTEYEFRFANKIR